MLSLRRTGLLALFWLIALSSASAQVTTATLYGVVMDSTGAVVPNAAATLTNEQTSATFRKVTDTVGEFQLDFVPAGTYTLRIEAPGFKAYEGKGVALTAGQQARQTYVLNVGSVNETIVVDGAAPLLNAVSAEQQQSLESAEAAQLPVQRRNVSNLLAVGTGVSDATGAVRMNGVGMMGTAYAVDGTIATGNTEGRSASNYGDTDYINIMSLEGIAEVQTVKGVMPAEYTDALGGHVNLITKSGTNRWHGSLMENFQSERLNARNQLLSTKAPLTFNEFGGSFGGAIRKNRIFFFTDYEGYRENAFTVVQGTVPTQQVRDTLLAAVPSYNLVLSWMPLPNQPTAANATTGTFLAAKTAHNSDNHVDAKGDILLTDSSRLSLTYARGRPHSDVPAIYTNDICENIISTTQERGTLSFTIGRASWTSESRFGYSVADYYRDDPFYNQFNPAKSTEQIAYGERIGQITTSLGWTTPFSALYDIHGPRVSFDQKISKTVGGHSLKFGGDYLNICCGKEAPKNPAYSYATMAQLLSNTPTQINVTFGNGLFAAHLWEFGLFAQDDWRITRNLVINIGLRYDYYSNLVAKASSSSKGTGFYNPDGLLDSNFDVGPMRPLNDPYNPDPVNFGPRFGFSYSPGSSGKTVIRGGFGVIFSAQIPGVMWQSVQPTEATPYRFIFTQQQVLGLGLKWPMYGDDFGQILQTMSAQTGAVNVFTVFDPNLRNPYTMQYTLGIQRQLTSSMMLDSAFVGVRGVKLIAERGINPVDRVTGLRPNPLLNASYYLDDSQQSVYTSWQTSLRKRYSRNLSGSVYYTWGKALSTEGGDIGAYFGSDTNTADIQDFFNMKAARGPSAGDVTHYFVSEGLYSLPRLDNWSKGFSKIAQAALGRWQASAIFKAQTGQAFTLTETSTLGGAGGGSGSRPDYIGGPAILANYRATLKYLNPAAFAKVPINAASGATAWAGNIGTGAVRGPGMWNLDFSLGKNFKVAERANLLFRIDMFNALNHTNLSGLTVEITNPRFGQLTSTNGARLVQLNARMSF